MMETRNKKGSNNEKPPNPLGSKEKNSNINSVFNFLTLKDTLKKTYKKKLLI